MIYWQILSITIFFLLSGLNIQIMANTYEISNKIQNNTSTNNQPSIGISRDLARLRAKSYSEVKPSFDECSLGFFRAELSSPSPCKR